MNTHGLRKILIIDWDLHHGNATQNSFYEDPDILYFSTHQYPHYPGTGSLREVGRGEGEGFTVNVPLSSGYGDADFFKILEETLYPIGRAFSPELIFVSAGFDTYVADPLGGMQVTPKGYAAMTRLIMELAGECSSERLAFTLEGGYHLTGLRESAKAVLKELSGESILTADDLESLRKAEAPGIVKDVMKVQRSYWPS
jgi:acetoin utilization deacetylase AcuC-like enzyme